MPKTEVVTDIEPDEFRELLASAASMGVDTIYCTPCLKGSWSGTTVTARAEILYRFYTSKPQVGFWMRLTYGPEITLVTVTQSILLDETNSFAWADDTYVALIREVGLTPVVLHDVWSFVPNPYRPDNKYAAFIQDVRKLHEIKL